MLIACMRKRGETTTSFIVEPDGDWSLLKIQMCQAWGIEHVFNQAQAWTALRDKEVVADFMGFYQVFDVEQQQLSGAELRFTAFEGRVHEILLHEIS